MAIFNRVNHSASNPVNLPPLPLPEMRKPLPPPRMENVPKPFRNALAAELAKAIRGEVRFDDGSRALYATTGSNYRQIPIGVVIPLDADDVLRTLEICRKRGAPVLSRGGGTSLAGQTENVAVVMDMSKYMNKVLWVDPERRLGRVQPGMILDDLRDAAEKHGLTFGPDPATHNHCTIGGMIGNNSCGLHSQMAGRTSDNIHELDIVTYDGTRMKVGATSDIELEQIIRQGGRRGEIYGRLKILRDRYGTLVRQRFPNIPRRSSGYNLDALLPENGFHVARALVGTESTCVTILEATTHLIPSARYKALAILGYPSVYEAGDHVLEIAEFKPQGLEGMDDLLVRDLSAAGNAQICDYLPEGRGWLMAEFGGDSQEEAQYKANAMLARLHGRKGAPSMRVLNKKEDVMRFWKFREGGLGATARSPGSPDTWEGWEDSSVPPENLGTYLRELRKLFNQHGYGCTLYGHFGQACVHTRIDFDFMTAGGIKNYRAFMEDATDLVVKLGGSFSGEHGDGQSKAEFEYKMFGPEIMDAFREFKTIWDPEWKMNPGKLVNPYKIDENLKFGTSFNPPAVETHFKFPHDKGNLPYATLRCVGIGECRKMEGGVMCPSFRVTREEKHSTRGRAHLMQEMLRGDSPANKGWKSEPVKEALDLCLSCKGCKSDCPTQVDMATYKSEFLSHYYEGRLRPLAAYAFGLIDQWARIGSLFPRLVNFLTQTWGFRAIMKAASGMSQKRKIPKFANQTFKSWFRGHRTLGSDRPAVILWADTFNNNFHPETAIAAVEVLEAAGYRVIVPPEHLCCGRPLYDYGMLDLAKTYLRSVISNLRPLIREGIPVVGLEPSCLAVFRDELRNLLPHDLDGMRLSKQTFILSEFLEKEATHFEIPKLHRKALVQGHCHHKSILKMDAEQNLFQKMELDANLLDSGCCGMAGSFGFENAKDHYDVSMKIGEESLLPAVRAASPDSLIIANGFSCREQIAQGTDRRAIHVAEALQMALHERKPQETPCNVQPLPLSKK